MNREQIFKAYRQRQRKIWGISIVSTIIFISLGYIACFAYRTNDLMLFAYCFSFGFVMELMTGIMTPIFLMESNIDKSEKLKSLDADETFYNNM